ncbi:uncharacterized protein LOC141628916 [Silene latifolia]|uniref:uncharacterized protein LOC141628916 n=1 Tax=Silene latifolia TaxID=37657 RepID=UPI003D771426
MDIIYQEGKANVVAGALSRKSLHALCIAMSLMRLKDEVTKMGIHVIQKRDARGDLTVEPELCDDIRRKQALDPKIQEWRDEEMKKIIMAKAHCTPYSVDPSGDKLYKDLKQTFWWPGMKMETAKFVARCLTCQRVKGEQQRPQGKIQSHEGS